MITAKEKKRNESDSKMDRRDREVVRGGSGQDMYLKESCSVLIVIISWPDNRRSKGRREGYGRTRTCPSCCRLCFVLPQCVKAQR